MYNSWLTAENLRDVMKTEDLPSDVRESKAVDLANCLAGALFFINNTNTLVTETEQCQWRHLVGRVTDGTRLAESLQNSHNSQERPYTKHTL